MPNRSVANSCAARSRSCGPELRGGLAPGLLANDVELDDARLLAGEMQSVGAHEDIVFKPRWGAFYNTPVNAYLRSIHADTIVFCGCNFPNCPRTSIYEASERDYRAVLAIDATSGLYDRGQEEMANIGVELATVAEITAVAERPARDR